MKCATHNSEAIGVCAHCGRAVCPDCTKSSAKQLTCSTDCAEALARNEKAMELILQKSLQNANASAFYSYLCSGLSAAGAIGAHFYLQSQFLIWFCAGCSAVFFVSGIRYGRIAQQNPRE
ncbi:MAG TPA: hypothetical protein VFV23_06930 [Verrucomicrobiae bacterium]|nr:hypothetical protein [Verrucomicrobiae bacterium]